MASFRDPRLRLTPNSHQIQTVVKEELSEATVITIAHRLKTTIGLDRILVLDEGRVVEFDTPQALLASDTRYCCPRNLKFMSIDTFYQCLCENVQVKSRVAFRPRFGIDIWSINLEGHSGANTPTNK